MIFLKKGHKGYKKSILSPHKSKHGKNDIVIYTDGGCIDNPGPGGYGAVIIHGKSRKKLSAGYRLTTSNRMEMMACIAALKKLDSPSKVTLYSDSQYVVNCISKGWAKRWRDNNWMTTTGPAKNIDLWKRLLALCEKHDVELIWVRGHSGVKENEICDQLATKAASRKKLLVDKVYENTLS